MHSIFFARRTLSPMVRAMSSRTCPHCGTWDSAHKHDCGIEKLCRSVCVFFWSGKASCTFLIDSLSAGRMRVLCALGGRYACVVCVRREGGMTVRFTEVLSGGLYEYVSDDVAGACA